ncbi:NADPH-dependent F420 reductase [Agromyces seonyuensis]|uniref:NADPH-dependent F420 reductase n=1 Tax=Agromyces seonyuensis TaxID=2662446 RepID=UPI003014CA3F
MERRAVIGIYGAGKVGTALARLLVGAGYEVRIAGSPRQTALELLVSVVAPGARVASPDEVADADVVVVAVPFGKADTVPWDRFDGTVVVDAMNYWPPIDGTIPAIEADGRPTSVIHADLNPRARLVKSLNHLGYHEMEDDALPEGDPLRRALAVAGDDPDARAAVAAIVDDIGFDAVDLGPLACGVLLEPGGPVFGRELDADELRRLAERRQHAA